MPGRKPEIAVLYDPSHTAEQGMVQGILTGSVMQVVHGYRRGRWHVVDASTWSVEVFARGATLPGFCSWAAVPSAPL